MASTYQIHKTLFIGVGGSGGTTLRFLHQELLNSLQEKGWDDELPACWQFLLMDVAGTPDGVSGRVPNVLTDKTSFFGLTDKHTSWDTFLDMVPEDKPEVVAGWKPEPPLPGEPFKGAGQLRALGRLVAMTRISEMKSRIDQSLLRLGSSDNALQDVARLFDCTAALGNTDMHVYIVTSLGGGSGSGMFLDISSILEALKIPHVNVLYAPDVFDQLTKSGSNKDVVANTFGAMSELLSAFEGNGSSSDADLVMMQRAGIALHLEGERTTDANIILGRRGDGYEFEEQNDVYHAAARILSAIALEGDLEEQIERYVFQNPSYLQSTDKLKNLKRPVNSRTTRNELATSMGMASVSTGRAAFGQYAAERLTNFIVDQLVDDGAALLELKTKKIEDFLNQARQFALQCRLGTPAGGRHQIMTDLLGEGLSQVTDTVKNIEQKVAAQLSKPLDAGNLDKAGVLDTIAQNFEAIRKSVGQEFALGRKQRVLQWTQDAQAQLFDTVLTSIVNNGMLHTIEYLKQLSVDLQATGNDFNSNSQKLKEDIASLRNQASQAFNAVGDRVKLVFGSPEVQQNLQLRSRDTAAQLENGTYSLVSELISDFIVGAVEPLTAELERLQSNFASSIATSVATKEHLASLADGPTPAHLIPPRNVVFLDSPDEFSQNLDGLLSGLYSGDPQADVNLRRAAREVLANAWQGRPLAKGEKAADQRFVISRASWSTSVQALLDATTQPTKGSYEVQNMDVFEIESIARRWQRTRTVVGDYTAISMKDYLYPENSPNRTAAFLHAFEQAIAMSGVMVEFDHDAVQRYSGGKNKPTIYRFVNGIPLVYSQTGTDPTTEAKAAIELMMKADFDLGDATKYIQRGSSATSVLVFSVIKEKTPPALFQAIGTPIYQQWAQIVANPNLRDDWYRLRRARALPSFIPVGVQVIEAMIKGWTIARGLGLIPASDVEEFKSRNGNSAIRLFDPDSAETSSTDGYVKFPQTVLLGGSSHGEMPSGDVLPSILESMLLGYVAISSGWLDAYARLAEIGFGLKDLKSWIRSGEVPNHGEASPGITPIDSLAAAGTKEERIANFIKYLDTRLDNHESVMKTVYSLDEIGEATREWELRREIHHALMDLKNQIADFSTEEESVPK